MKKMLFASVAVAALMGAGQAMADDWSNSGSVVSSTVSSPQNWVAIDGTGAPVDTDQVNADGTFKATAPAGAIWADPASLTQTQRDAIAADVNAATYYPTSGARRTTTTTDTTTGDTESNTKTDGGVSTSHTLSNGTNTTSFTANGLTTTGTVEADRVIAGGVDLGAQGAANTAAIADHEGRITNNSEQIAGLTSITAQHSAAIADLRGDVSDLYKLNAMAMALPNLYLGDRERVSFAMGGGFNENAGAFAAGGMFRINGNWAGYGAVSTDFQHVGGKVGIRTGW